jgi:hypothetical protein
VVVEDPALKLWTGKFVAALALILTYVVSAFSRPLNQTTGERPHLLRFLDTGPASFVFLLVFLFAVSHAGSWVLARLRSRRAEGPDSPPPKTPTKKKRRR